MPTFFDDFERANGALGSNWATLSGTSPVISGGSVGGNSWVLGCLAVSDSGYADCEIHCFYGSTNSYQTGPFIKGPGTTGNGFSLELRDISATPVIAITSSSSGGGAILASTTLASKPGPYISLRITWELGHIVGYLNGVAVVQADSSLSAAGFQSGFHTFSSAGAVADFRAVGGTAVALDVNEAVVGNFGSCTELHLTGTGTSWTPGTPGSPAFTVDHGTISGQTVLTATTATVTYCPASYLGMATITDPSTGTHDSFLVTSDTGIVLPPGTDLERPTQAGADLLDDKANDVRHSGTVVTNEQPMLTVPVMSYVETVASIWGYLRYVATGINPPTEGVNPSAETLKWVSGDFLRSPSVDLAPSNTTLKQDLAALLTQFDELRTITGYDLQGVMNIIRGADLRNITEVYDAVGSIGTGSNQDVLDRLNEIQGPGFYTLNSIVNLLQAIRTASDWSLGSVKSWIDALPRDWSTHADTASILAAITAMGAVLAGVAAAETEDAAASTAAAAGIVGVAATLLEMAQQILDILNALRELTARDTEAAPAPPIWPGVGKVTWGSPVALEANIPVLGMMHWVVVDVVSCEGGTRFFDYDGIRNWSHVGALAFETDSGYLEPFQVLGMARGIYTPTRMPFATACRLYRSRNVRGTITPWTVTP